MQLPQKSPWLVGLVLASVLIRWLLLGGYEPVSYPDTGTYLAAARDLLSGTFAEGQGRRTPGYPLLIAWVGEAPGNIALAQMALGVTTAVLMFCIAWLMTRSAGLAFALGLLFSLNLQQLSLEVALVTEALTAFAVAAAVLVLLLSFRRLRAGKSALLLCLLTGGLAAAAILVRPQFIFMVPLLPLLVIYACSGPRWPSLRALAHAAVIALPGIVAVLGWAAVVQAKTGYFALSTQSGMGLVNHSVEFIELAPLEYAQVRDILLKHRAERIAAAGHAGNTIWYAWPEIQQATGWSLPEASRQLQKMSTQMFAEHPVRYALSVARPWLEFWTVPIFWDPKRFEPSWLAGPLQATWWVQHKLLRAANLAFVLLVAAVIVWPRVRNAVHWDLDATAISALVLASSLLQAMADRGAGSRYAVTTQALVVLVVVVSAWRWHAGKRSASGAATGVPVERPSAARRA